MQALLLIVRLIPPRLLRWLLRRNFETVRQLPPAALACDMKTKPVLLLDVRTQVEYESGHLAGAHHITDVATAQRLIEVFQVDEPLGRVVAYCTVGYRSAQFAQRMARIGGAQVENLEGGIWAWSAAGQPIVTQRAVTAKQP